MGYEYEHEVFDWENEGTVPDENIRKKGFQVGYKPPAAFFNAFWHSVSRAIKELQEKLNQHDDDSTAMYDYLDGQVANLDGQVANKVDKTEGMGLAGFGSSSSSSKKWDTIVVIDSSSGEATIKKIPAYLSDLYIDITGKPGAGDKSEVHNGSTGADGQYSFAAGLNSTATGRASFAINQSIARGNFSFSAGQYTNANMGQAVLGMHNKEFDGSDKGTTGTAFIVGIGTPTTKANALRVGFDGVCRGSSSFLNSGADYAEYFEWVDGNPDNEDRRGYFVTLEGNKIRKATSKDDYILGIVSAEPAVIGNAYTDMWKGMYLRDVFGTRITEVVDVPEEKDEETGEVIVPAHQETHFVINPEYDSTKEYVGREHRKEWSAVGSHGQLVVIDDGSCEVNGYATVADGGTAVKSSEKTGFRVIERIDETHIKVFIK